MTFTVESRRKINGSSMKVFSEIRLGLAGNIMDTKMNKSQMEQKSHLHLPGREGKTDRRATDGPSKAALYVNRA